MVKTQPNKISPAILTHINLSQKGKHTIDKLTSAVQSVPITVMILELAWTAGPVTLIALQLGSILGFGKFASLSTVIYFASYTIIAGIIATSTRYIYSHVNQENKQDTRNHYKRVIEQLLDAYMLSRDFLIQEQESSAQQSLVAAKIMLNGIFVPPATIAAIAKDITGNTHFSDIVHSIIIIYRRSSIHAYADTLLKQLHKAFNDTMDDIYSADPALYDLLKKHLSGELPNLHDGYERPSGFIERLYSASIMNDSSIVSIQDIQSLFSLTLEFLWGRKFHYFTFHAKGQRTRKETFLALEKSRYEYTSTLSGLYSRINALSAILFDEDECTEVNHDLRTTSIEEIIKDQHEKITEIAISLRNEIRRRDLPFSDFIPLHEELTELQLAIKIYRKILAQILRLEKKSRCFKKMIQQWELLNIANVNEGARLIRERLPAEQCCDQIRSWMKSYRERHVAA